MATYDETVQDKTTQEVTVPPKATRRVLSPSYKARILKVARPSNELACW